jgi:hypothetical protein
MRAMQTLRKLPTTLPKMKAMKEDMVTLLPIE